MARKTTNAKATEMPEKEQRDLMTEIKTGRRVFDTSRGLVQIRFPKVEENRLADWEYTRVLTQAIKDGIMTNKQMRQFIEENELWTDADEKEIEALNAEIDKQIVVLSKMGENTKNADKVEAKINELRQQVFQKQQERQKFFNNTAEAKADESKMSFLLYKCSEDAETNKPLWESYDAFKNEEDQELVNTIVFQFLTFINGLPADFLSYPSASKGETEEDEAIEE